MAWHQGTHRGREKNQYHSAAGRGKGARSQADRTSGMHARAATQLSGQAGPCRNMRLSSVWTTAEGAPTLHPDPASKSLSSRANQLYRSRDSPHQLSSHLGRKRLWPLLLNGSTLHHEAPHACNQGAGNIAAALLKLPIGTWQRRMRAMSDGCEPAIARMRMEACLRTAIWHHLSSTPHRRRPSTGASPKSSRAPLSWAVRIAPGTPCSIPKTTYDRRIDVHRPTATARPMRLLQRC